MTNPELGVLTDVDVRLAWAHEAHSFTPWLAQHLDALAAVIGIPLELEGREVSVETFYADILARNPQDGSLVLIENQLEGTDHSHLGQIMTYLAGLEAETVVWVATSFREAHLSALNWLNEHTADTFSFFAVKVKAVRIGDSPIAPVFEVVQRPNRWDRKLQSIARETQGLSSLGQVRREFWQAYVERFPDELTWGPATAASNRWRALSNPSVVISMYVAGGGVGVFIRGQRGAPNEVTYNRLVTLTDRLTAASGGQLGNIDDAYHFQVTKTGDTSNRAVWPDLMDWLHATANAYQAALSTEGTA